MPDSVFDQLLAGADASAAFKQGKILDALKKAFAERALNTRLAIFSAFARTGFYQLFAEVGGGFKIGRNSFLGVGTIYRPIEIRLLLNGDQHNGNQVSETFAHSFSHPNRL